MFRLREVRKEHKMSQQELASILGVTQATLSGWETEKYEIDTKSLVTCAEYYQVSVDYLLGKTDIKNTEPSGTVSEDDIKIALFGGAEDVTDAMWQEAKAFAEYIKDRELRKKGS